MQLFFYNGIASMYFTYVFIESIKYHIIEHT